MNFVLKSQLLGLFFLTTLAACSGKKSEEATTPAGSGGGASYQLSGTVTYDWVPALDNVTEGGVRLGYASKAAKAARRVQVVALEGSTEVASANTNDSGQFQITVPDGKSVTLRVKARSQISNSTADGIAPDLCVGATWDIRILNNKTDNSASNTNASLRPLYVLDGATTYSSATANISLHAPLSTTGSGASTTYTNRAAAPFAMLDVMITQLELVCQGTANMNFPALIVNWSVDNTPSAGNKYQGLISTSHYTNESSTGPNLYILGKAGADTDEYDDHVVAHEFGHYLEDQIYRSDSIGGAHQMGDALDPRVAFGEGYGNALSAMTFNDPIYVDTGGAGQQSGFSINIGTAPSGDDRGVYSERSVQYLLWRLYDNRDGTANSGHYSRIHNTLRNSQKNTTAFTSVLSFVAYYNESYGGSAESLQTLWVTNLDSPFNALCSGACSGTGDTADPFDVDNDLGTHYNAQGRKYRPSTGSTFSAEFWRLYRNLSTGLNTGNDHDQTHFGGYSGGAESNKFGTVRWYRYLHSAANGSVTINVESLGASNCTTDVLNMLVWRAGSYVNYDFSTSGATAGCPSVTFSAVNGVMYTIELRGVSTQIPSFNLRVQ